MQDIVDEDLKKQISYVTYEALVSNPEETMRLLYRWLGLPNAPFDRQRLSVKPHESDSYYRFKYRHATHSSIRPAAKHVLPPRIEREIIKNFVDQQRNIESVCHSITDAYVGEEWV